MPVIVFLLLVVAAVVFGVAAYLTPRGAGRLIPLGLCLTAAALALERFPF